MDPKHSDIKGLPCITYSNKGAAYMPYLTLSVKISQNLAHLEANSHKIFQIS